ncbi:MAG: hypothetical protein QOD98_4192 [Nocardioidaceae bacterium]|jgi:uncharacterized protein with FMN-binding domain|nr:hypothetical protein [Nocardioidaceae bacterium]
MKRIVLWLLSTVSAVVLLFGYHTSTSGPSATAQAPVGASLATTSTATTSGGGGGTGKQTSGTTTTGQVAQTRWGPVQVQITTSASGKITDVQVIQYPSGNREDDQINAYALPQLVQATLDAQSANIDMVSGATVTSEGYLQSLQSAIDQATA